MNYENVGHLCSTRVRADEYFCGRKCPANSKASPEVIPERLRTKHATSEFYPTNQPQVLHRSNYHGLSRLESHKDYSAKTCSQYH